MTALLTTTAQPSHRQQDSVTTEYEKFDGSTQLVQLQIVSPFYDLCGYVMDSVSLLRFEILVFGDSTEIDRAKAVIMEAILLVTG